MAKRKVRTNPSDPNSELMEVEDEEAEEETVDESSPSEKRQERESRSEEGTRTLELDRAFTYRGTTYGPGETELSNEAADSIENRMKKLKEIEEKEREEGLRALAGGTQTQVNNTVAPMEYFQEQRVLDRAHGKEVEEEKEPAG